MRPKLQFAHIRCIYVHGQKVTWYLPVSCTIIDTVNPIESQGKIVSRVTSEVNASQKVWRSSRYLPQHVWDVCSLHWRCNFLQMCEARKVQMKFRVQSTKQIPLSLAYCLGDLQMSECSSDDCILTLVYMAGSLLDMFKGISLRVMVVQKVNPPPPIRPQAGNHKHQQRTRWHAVLLVSGWMFSQGLRYTASNMLIYFASSLVYASLPSKHL